MKKILHMTPPDVQNGVYRYIFNHMPYINPNEYQFAFLTKAEKDLKKTDEYRKYHFPVYCLHNTERDNKLGLEQEIKTILGEGFDAIHLHTSSWRGFFIEEVAMAMGVRKVIVHSHSTGIDELDDSVREERMKTHMWYRERFSMKYATDVCACSRLAAEWLFGNNIPKEEIKILPNAIDVSKYRFDSCKRIQIRKQLGVTDRVVIGNVGRYCYQKNQEFLVEVFAEAYKWNPNLFLLCIGQGENREKINKMIEKMGLSESAICLGWKENIEDYLQAMDLFALPSRFEGLGIAAIEAQAAGLKCLLADTVPAEVKVTNLPVFLPLEKEIWTEHLVKAAMESNRECYDFEIAEKGFDIQSASNKLVKLYD